MVKAFNNIYFKHLAACARPRATPTGPRCRSPGTTPRPSRRSPSSSTRSATTPSTSGRSPRAGGSSGTPRRTARPTSLPVGLPRPRAPGDRRAAEGEDWTRPCAHRPLLRRRSQLPWTGQPPTASRMEPLAVSDSTAKHDPARLDKVVNLCKRRGFVFPSGEIYGGTRSAWDYGPLGVELKENIKRQWWRSMVQSRDDIVGLDSSVILPRQVWVASGHVGVFTDPLVECLNCHKRFRADHLEEEFEEKKGRAARERPGRHRLPELRHPGPVDRAARLQHDAQDLPRPGRGRVRPALPAAGDRAGHLRELRQRAGRRPQEAAVRHRPDRQVVPQRDHAGQLHLPHARVRADGDGVLRRARHRRGVAPVLDRPAHPLVHRPRHRPRQPAALRAPEGEAVALLEAHGRHRVPLRLPGLGVGRARGHRQPHRLRPEDALASTPATTCRTSTRRRTTAGRRTSSSRRPASPAR